MSEAQRRTAETAAEAASLPLQGPLDRLTQFIGRYAMLGLFVMGVGFVAVRLAAAGFPDAGAVFDGRDILSDQTRPNYLRNFLELMSFLAPVGLLAAALWAFDFTKKQIAAATTQIEEARQARLATLYATLEQRWSSPEMIRSKALFTQITRDYGAYSRAAVLGGQPAVSLGAFAHDALMTMQKDRLEDYFTFMALPEYLEYIGMLFTRKYANLDDISYILGMVCIEVATTMANHIEYLRSSVQGSNSYPEAPKEFICLDNLAEAFMNRFKGATAA